MFNNYDFLKETHTHVHTKQWNWIWAVKQKWLEIQNRFSNIMFKLIKNVDEDDDQHRKEEAKTINQ